MSTEQRGVDTTRRRDAGPPSPAGLWRRGQAVVSARSSWIYPVLAAAIAVAAWQVLVNAFDVPAYLVPTPGAIVTAAVHDWHQVLSNTWPTIFETIAGFAVGALAGVALGIMVVAWSAFEKAFYPLIVAFQGVPKVALAPVFIVWFGFGTLPKVLMAALIAFFPVVVDTATGLRSIDPAYLELGRAMRGTQRRIYWRIVLPNAMPHIFAGLKVAMALAVVGAIVGELVGGNEGLGYLLTVANGNVEIALAFAVLVWLAIVSFLLIGLIDLLERLVMPWRRSLRTKAELRAVP